MARTFKWVGIILLQLNKLLLAIICSLFRSSAECFSLLYDAKEIPKKPHNDFFFFFLKKFILSIVIYGTLLCTWQREEMGRRRRTRKGNKNNDNQMKHDMAHCQQFIFFLLLREKKKFFLYICCSTWARESNLQSLQFKVFFCLTFFFSYKNCIIIRDITFSGKVWQVMIAPR